METEHEYTPAYDSEDIEPTFYFPDPNLENWLDTVFGAKSRAFVQPIPLSQFSKASLLFQQSKWKRSN